MPFFQKRPKNSHTVSCNIPRTEHCAMALSLDMACQTERVIIGEMQEIPGIPSAASTRSR